MQVNRGCLDNKRTHAPTRWRIDRPDDSPTMQMLGDTCTCGPRQDLLTAPSRSDGSVLARVARRHTDNGGRGSLKACSGRWRSWNLLLSWASNIREPPVFMQVVGRGIGAGHGEMHRHVFLGRLESVMELPF